MNYQFTGPDVFMICVVVAVIVMLVVHRPRQHHPRRTVCFKMGINAIRVTWTTGAEKLRNPDVHGIKIQLNRVGDVFPTVGDILTFIEVDQKSWRGKVQGIELVQERRLTDTPKSRPAAILSVIEKW